MSEKEKRNCIFYLPYPLEASGNRARLLRPRKLVYAFRELGYRVFLIQGYSEKRRMRIEMLKGLIDSGTKFDFMYAECNTEPLHLSDPSHIPVHPVMDFNFFRYLKKEGIPIGLFYCDIYWKFPTYRELVKGWKRQVSLHFYKSELRSYAKLLTCLFVPDMRMCQYFDSPDLEKLAAALPPGGDPVPAEQLERKETGKRDFQKDPLQIFYVGGISEHYRIDELLSAIRDLPEVCLTLCVREGEWDKEKERLEDLMTDRVTVVHKNEDELGPFYQKADIGSLLFYPDEYRGMAQPVKAYEYICHGLPAIASKNTAIGELVEGEGTGWTCEYRAEEIREILTEILRDPGILAEKRRRTIEVIPDHLWITRAGRAAELLTEA